MIEELRGRFTIDDGIVSTVPGTELDRGTSQERYRAWRQWLRDHGVKYPKEFLVPRIVRDIRRAWPDWMTPRVDLHRPPAELLAQALAIGPWMVPFRLGGDALTTGNQVAAERFLFRRELITATLADVLGDDLATARMLDIGCHNGFFSFDIAARGAQHVTGVDLRDMNIDQARFLADVYGFDNVTFTTSDVNALPDDQYDVVMNLGVLYHVTDPLPFLRQTYDLTRRLAVIDTVVDPDPVSAFVFLADKDVSHAAEGRDVMELHPTYRAAIELIRNVGFREVIEVVGQADPPHPFYDGGIRRCFLAVK